MESVKIKCDKCNKEFSSKEALNMHNRSKHPAEYKEPLLSTKSKKRVRNYAILLIFLLAVAGLYYWRTIPPKNAPSIMIEPSSYNFGVVRQSEGVVTAAMSIENKGTKDLIIKKIDASCGCTSASIVKDGIESPKFSMSHGKSAATNWKEILKPGESAQLKVYYDPNVHKELEGLIKRSISVYSNDPRNSVKEVVVSANQVRQ